MQLLPHYQSKKINIKMTAMIDVVFLLIIFFMTVSQIDKDVREELPLPVADQGKEVQDRNGRVIVNVMRDGRLIISQKTYSSDELKSLLHNQIQENGADNVKCILRVHSEAPFQHIQDILGHLAQSGIWRVAYSVTEEET